MLTRPVRPKLHRGWLLSRKWKRSNCLLFALALWLTNGGYLGFRRTRTPLPYGLHWHWLTVDQKHCLHYEPIRRMKSWPAALMHKVWYAGRIRKHDTPWRGGH